MNLRFFGNHVPAPLLILGASSLSEAQVRKTQVRRPQVRRPAPGPSNSASHVAAEMTAGKISPVESKPGDTVMVQLQSDVKANGQVVLKKGTTITGVIRNL